MMNLAGKINYKKKNILAAVGGLLLFTLMCGCGETGNIIIIGTADEQEAGLQPGENLPGTEQAGSERDNISVENLRQSEGQEFRPEERQTLSEQGTEVKDEALIRIYVCGAVANPGVVSVPEGSRVEDALLEAGGFSSDAMQQALNLADWVYDGQMLYFPAEGEDLEHLMSGGWPGGEPGGGQNMGSGQGGGQSAGGSQSAGQNQVGLVNINTADAAALATLPGIGEGRAQDIIAYREKNGGFASCEDIMKVSGIKTSVYEKICDKITVK